VSKSSSSEDDSFVATSKGSFRKNMSSKIPVRSSTAMPSKKSTTAPAAKSKYVFIPHLMSSDFVTHRTG
jgi:hypothetical protein